MKLSFICTNRATPQSSPVECQAVKNMKARNSSYIESFIGRACAKEEGEMANRNCRAHLLHKETLKCIAEPTGKASEDTINWTERWNFLKQLPHKLIRDIGMVIASPPILMDSHELPMVCPDLLGGGSKSWFESAKWLATVEVDQVKRWFEAKSNNGRLGEHFAFCVEYVLLFSPIAHSKNLLTCQQVTYRAALGSSPQVPKVGIPSYGREESDIMSKLAVEVTKGDVVIKLNSYGHHNSLSKGVGTVHDICPCSPLSPTLDTLSACKDLQKLAVQGEEETSQDEQAGGPKGNVTKVTESWQDTSEKIGKRKRKLLRKMQRLKDGKGSTLTIGEFDFLFEQANTTKQDHQLCPHKALDLLQESGWKNSLETCLPAGIDETKIYHWEVSVKFLLYAGPWEMFGFETPCHAAWKSSYQDSQEQDVEVHPDITSIETSRGGDFGCTRKDAWHKDDFLGCFLGPHVGETLYNRKTRLLNQVSLSRNTHAASLLYRLFGHTPAEKMNCPPKDSIHTCIESSCTTHSIDSQHVKVLRVSPRALLKGYLFYEYHLWYQLCQRDNDGCGQHSVQWAGKEPCFETLDSAMGCHDVDNYSKSKLNPEHWMGWWTRMNDFVKFAQLPIHEHSKWYIVPKLGWLSPVVLRGEDEAHCKQVLSVEEFLIVAAKVAEEAERTNISRKRRFMVAEMFWEFEQLIHSSHLACKLSELQCDIDGSSKGRGKWTEISRGFVVEDTWPDSRLYKPHGYRLSWSTGSPDT